MFCILHHIWSWNRRKKTRDFLRGKKHLNSVQNRCLIIYHLLQLMLRVLRLAERNKILKKKTYFPLTFMRMQYWIVGCWIQVSAIKTISKWIIHNSQQTDNWKFRSAMHTIHTTQIKRQEHSSWQGSGVKSAFMFIKSTSNHIRILAELPDKQHKISLQPQTVYIFFVCRKYLFFASSEFAVTKLTHDGTKCKRMKQKNNKQSECLQQITLLLH